MFPTKPALCCTCSNWYPSKHDIRVGLCKKKKGNSNYDEDCGLWKETESGNENDSTAAILGYD